MMLGPMGEVMFDAGFGILPGEWYQFEDQVCFFTYIPYVLISSDGVMEFWNEMEMILSLGVNNG